MCPARLAALAEDARYRALTALMLLTPCTPLLFQGQEFAASAPFLYFARRGEELDPLIRKGRHEFLTQFPPSEARMVASCWRRRTRKRPSRDASWTTENANAMRR